MTQFLCHPWYSPRQETIITAALQKANVDPNLFLETANQALTEEDGRYFQQVADRLKAELDRRSIGFQSLSVQQGEPHG